MFRRYKHFGFVVAVLAAMVTAPFLAGCGDREADREEQDAYRRLTDQHQQRMQDEEFRRMQEIERQRRQEMFE